MIHPAASCREGFLFIVYGLWLGSRFCGLWFVVGFPRIWLSLYWLTAYSLQLYLTESQHPFIAHLTIINIPGKSERVLAYLKKPVNLCIKNFIQVIVPNLLLNRPAYYKTHSIQAILFTRKCRFTA